MCTTQKGDSQKREEVLQGREIRPGPPQGVQEGSEGSEVNSRTHIDLHDFVFVYCRGEQVAMLPLAPGPCCLPDRPHRIAKVALDGFLIMGQLGYALFGLAVRHAVGLP